MTLQSIKPIGWTFALWLFWILPGNAQQPDQLLKEADAAFQAKDYQSAIEAYQKLIDAGYRQAKIYYNQGNSYAALGDRGHAVISYERALRLNPHDRDTRHNLALISKPVEDAITVLPPFFLTRWLQSVATIASASAWAWWSVLFAWILLGAVVAYIWLYHRITRTVTGPLVIVSLVLLLCSFAFGWYRNVLLHDHSLAVVIREQTEFKYAPEANSETVHSLLAGTRLEVVDTISNWYKVILTNKDEGWVEKFNVEKL